MRLSRCHSACSTSKTPFLHGVSLIALTTTHGFTLQILEEERKPLMTLQVMLRLANGSTSLRTYENAYALINAHTQFLEVYRNKVLIASFHSDNFIGWEYVATPQQPTASRAQVLLQQPQG
jgi:hypothetical protein